MKSLDRDAQNWDYSRMETSNARGTMYYLTDATTGEWLQYAQCVVVRPDRTVETWSGVWRGVHATPITPGMPVTFNDFTGERCIQRTGTVKRVNTKSVTIAHDHGTHRLVVDR